MYIYIREEYRRGGVATAHRIWCSLTRKGGRGRGRRVE